MLKKELEKARSDHAPDRRSSPDYAPWSEDGDPQTTSHTPSRHMACLMIRIANATKKQFKFGDRILVFVNGNRLIAQLDNLPAYGRDTTVALGIPSWCLYGDTAVVRAKIVVIRDAKARIMKPNKMRVLVGTNLCNVNMLSAARPLRAAGGFRTDSARELERDARRAAGGIRRLVDNGCRLRE